MVERDETDNNGKIVSILCDELRTQLFFLVRLSSASAVFSIVWLKLSKVESTESETILSFQTTEMKEKSSKSIRSLFALPGKRGKELNIFLCVFPHWLDFPISSRLILLLNVGRAERKKSENLMMMTMSVFIQFLGDYFALSSSSSSLSSWQMWRSVCTFHCRREAFFSIMLLARNLLDLREEMLFHLSLLNSLYSSQPAIAANST